MATTGTGAPVLSASTLRSYAAGWELFSDWCAVTDHQALPADPSVVVAFLAECPAAPKTQRGRVAAIDHHHASTGYASPGRSPMVFAALGRPTGGPPDAAGALTTVVEVALRALPSHGWTQGMFGRRDRCLLVLSQLAGVPFRDLAVLTAGDVTVVGGVAAIASSAGAITLTVADDPVVCGPCALTRWLRALDVVMTKPSHRVLAKQLTDAEPVTDQSPHLCRSTREISSLVVDVPLLPSIDQWGYVPFPVHRLSPHSLSRLVHQTLAGDLVVHRQIPVNEEVPDLAGTPAPVPAVSVYTPDDAKLAWARRRADLENLAGIDDVLAEIDARAKELDRRTVDVLARNKPAIERANP